MYIYLHIYIHIYFFIGVEGLWMKSNGRNEIFEFHNFDLHHNKLIHAYIFFFFNYFLFYSLYFVTEMLICINKIKNLLSKINCLS